MNKYVGTKTVKAVPCSLEAAINQLGRTITPSTGETEGYFVEYEDGYKSWSPKSTFEKTYRSVDGMTFGQAVEALKKGLKVARREWNGKGMFLWLKPATVVKSEWCKDSNLKNLCDKNGGELLALGTICMYTHDSTGRNAILTGWLASQSDILLEDWQIVEE